MQRVYRWVTVVSVASLFGCGGAEGSPEPPPEPSEVVLAEETEEAEATVPVEASEPPAIIANRAALQFSIDLSGPGLTPVLPRGDTLIGASGPPGGPLFIRVYEIPTSSSLAADALRVFAESKMTESGASFELGAPTTAPLGRSTSLPAIAAVAGSSPGRTVQCFIAHGNLQDRGGLVVHVGVAASDSQTPDCTPVAEHDSIAPALASFRIR